MTHMPRCFLVVRAQWNKCSDILAQFLQRSSSSNSSGSSAYPALLQQTVCFLLLNNKEKSVFAQLSSLVCSSKRLRASTTSLKHAFDQRFILQAVLGLKQQWNEECQLSVLISAGWLTSLSRKRWWYRRHMNNWYERMHPDVKAALVWISHLNNGFNDCLYVKEVAESVKPTENHRLLAHYFGFPAHYSTTWLQMNANIALCLSSVCWNSHHPSIIFLTAITGAGRCTPPPSHRTNHTDVPCCC